MYDAWGPAKNTTASATSCASQIFPSGISATREGRKAGSSNYFRRDSVNTSVGATAFTVTLIGAHSMASVRVSCSTPALPAP